ncbi:hypothetical protein NB550_13170 [Vibrio parahaemolyticus]|uniref:hypothetical protein n=1 Tax=Vibrio parahaemolyticus TaxID=670 RepID=UPI00215CE219|nr:hypothetical protein [Vibrio parahaemolyticus]EKH9208454.1 hypothetical protein [Vibrio parahaemolyticus]MCR9887009.1 hypothetical protein [Vibrio parahaemolyticus]MCR9918446.1 hypothetical protein [Vibrio parahaemolyticus]
MKEIYINHQGRITKTKTNSIMWNISIEDSIDSVDVKLCNKGTHKQVSIESLPHHVFELILHCCDLDYIKVHEVDDSTKNQFYKKITKINYTIQDFNKTVKEINLNVDYEVF